MDKAYLLAADIEKIFGIKKQHLEIVRRQGKGPAYTKFGGRYLYRVEDIEAYLNSRRVVPEN